MPYNNDNTQFSQYRIKMNENKRKNMHSVLMFIDLFLFRFVCCAWCLNALCFPRSYRKHSFCYILVFHTSLLNFNNQYMYMFLILFLPFDMFSWIPMSIFAFIYILFPLFSKMKSLFEVSIELNRKTVKFELNLHLYWIFNKK